MARSKKKNTNNGKNNSDEATNDDGNNHYQAYYSDEHERDFYVDSSSSKKKATWYAPSVAILDEDDAPQRNLAMDELLEEQQVEESTRSESLIGSVWTWAFLYVVGIGLLTWIRLSIPVDKEFTTSVWSFLPTTASSVELELEPVQPKTLDPALAEQMQQLGDDGKKNKKQNVQASDFLFTPWVLLDDDVKKEPDTPSSSEL